MSTAFIDFLLALGFTDVRQTSRKDVIELVVSEALKAARRNLRSQRIQFKLVESSLTPNATIQKFYAVQSKQVVGQLILTSYRTHSVIHLSNSEAK